MNDKRIAFAFILALAVLFQVPVVPVGAQSTDLEAQRIEVARAKEIVRQLKAGKQPTKEDIDLLEVLLTKLEKANSHGGAAEGGPASTVNPAPLDKRDGRQPVQVPSGLSTYSTQDGPVYLYVVDLNTSSLDVFWLDRRGQPYGSIAKLRDDQYRDGYTLQFAINGGIFDQRFRPQGLYIEQGRVLAELDATKPGPDMGNFYLEPNGVFVIDFQGDARVLTTQRYLEQFPSKHSDSIRLAVQSGPALLVDGVVNRLFTEASANKKRRSGVGVLGPRRIVFGMSAKEASFYAFADVFKALGCRDALYLDGGPIPAMYSKADKLSISVDTALVTMFGVLEKQRGH